VMSASRPVVTVLPGVPGMPNLVADGGRVPYPDSTVDFVKILKELGVDVVFTEVKEERRYAGHKAAEHWLPILETSRDLLLGMSGGLFVEVIKSYLGADASDESVLHVDWRVKHADGREERFVADGASQDVLEALSEFERRNREG
jgi:hypothetical protein